MDNFKQNWETECQNLLTNLTSFYDKNNSSAGTRTRKSAQELKRLLQDLRKQILEDQKVRKVERKKAKESSSASETTTATVAEQT